MDDAGLTVEGCAYRAANSIVDFAGGIGIGDEDQVRSGFRQVEHSPLEVEVDSKHTDPTRHKAEVMCAACGMCVVIAGGFTDYQRVYAAKSRECPVFTGVSE